jgi:hypothetical protein
MKEISEVLSGVLKEANEQGALLEKVICAMWNQVIGKSVAQHAMPLHFFQGTLTVAVATEAWKKQLEALGGAVIDKINVQLRQRKLERIHFVIKNTNALPPPEKVTGKAADSLPVQNVALGTIEKASAIQDEELRELFTRAARQNLNLQTLKKAK